MHASWLGKPEYNGIKVLLLALLLAVFGYFVFNYMNTGTLLGTGQVLQTGASLTASQNPITGVPAVATTSATAITAASATLAGSVPQASMLGNASVSFIYGASAAYGLTAPAVISNGTATAGVSGLKCNTTYHYRISAKNATGGSDGADMTFKTGLCS